MEHGLLTAWIQLEDCSATAAFASGSAAVEGGAIEIARGVPHQTGIGICAIRCAPSEVVQHSQLASRIQLKHRPVAETPVDRSAVEIARRVPDHAGPGNESVPARPFEAVEDPESLRLRRLAPKHRKRQHTACYLQAYPRKPRPMLH